jgi:hypothetical protein
MMGSIKDLGPPAGDGMTVAFRPDGTPIFDFLFEGECQCGCGEIEEHGISKMDQFYADMMAFLGGSAGWQ